MLKSIADIAVGVGKKNHQSKQQDTALGRIYRKVSELNVLQAKVAQYLPLELKSHCQVANIENNVLKLAVDNASWGTQLRYVLPELLETLRNQAGFPGLISIEYYIEPEFAQLFYAAGIDNAGAG